MTRARRNPRGSQLRAGELTDFTRAYLLTGIGFDFLRGEGEESGAPFSSDAAAKRAWMAHRKSLLAETGKTCKPWAAYQWPVKGQMGLPKKQALSKKALLADADARRDQPIFPDSIQRGDWRMDDDFLWDIHTHQWHSEHARPASEHTYFKTAIDDALKGRNVAGAKWNPVWMRTWTDVEAVRLGCWFDQDRADHVVAFFRLLRHSKGKFAKRPFVLLPWQKFDVIMPLFGWQRPLNPETEDNNGGRVGIRRYSHGYIEIPKKNGKSTLCAGISLYLAVADAEPGAEVYNVAAAIDQAKIVFKEALRMAKACPYFQGVLVYKESVKQILYPAANAEYVVISSDAATAEGKNISGIIFDELHAQKNRELFDALVYGGDAREQALFLSITTAGIYDPLSIGWEQHQQARRCLAGEAGPGEDTSFFGYIRAVVEDEKDADGNEIEGCRDRWQEEYWWYRSNPSLGIALTLDKFERAAKTAADTASKQNSFKRYKVNVWVQAAEAAFNITTWNKGAILQDVYGADRLRQFEKLIEGRRCFAGLDLSATSDLTAAVLWFAPEEEDGLHYVLPRFWLPEENIAELEQKSNAPYQRWADEGWMDLTPGDMVDLSSVRQGILEWVEQFGPVNWRFDPHRAAGLTTQLDEKDGLEMVRFTQSNTWMHAPTEDFETLIKLGQVCHCGHPIFDWMMGNCEFNRNSGDQIRIVKTRGVQRFKVDGPVAAVMARDGSMRDSGEAVSAYETQELATI